MGPIYNFDQVYYAESLDDDVINPVAIRPEIFEDRIQWLDTSKGKIVRLGKIENMGDFANTAPDEIKITGLRGEHIKLSKLTLDIYNESVKKNVMLPPDFSSDEEVQRFYLNTDFEIY